MRLLMTALFLVGVSGLSANLSEQVNWKQTSKGECSTFKKSGNSEASTFKKQVSNSDCSTF